jgi:hypothetical protein
VIKGYTDIDDLDIFPLAPFEDGGEICGTASFTRIIKEDTKGDFEAHLYSRSGNILQSAAVHTVQPNARETGVLDCGQIVLDGSS